MAGRIRAEPKDAAPLAGRPWTRQYDPGVPATLSYPDVPLHALLEDAARTHTDAIATIFLGATRTYRTVQRDATFFSAGLRKLGVKKGDRVALVLPNCPQFLIAFFGTLRIGAVVVPCDPLFTPHELQQRLADSGAETVVVLSRHYPTVKAARTGTAVRDIIVTTIKEELPFARRLVHTLVREGPAGDRVRWHGDPGTHAFRELLAYEGEPVAAPVAPADLAVLQYTERTTGHPKAAMLSHAALVANALQCRAWLTGLKDATERIMGAVPLFQAYGLTVALDLAVQSASALILEPGSDVPQVLRDVRDHRPSIFPGAPHLFDAIVDAPGALTFDLRSVRVWISGSGPLSEATARRFHDVTGGRVVAGGGLAEAAPLTHCGPVHGDGRQRAGSVGVPLPDVESRIVDLESGTRELPPGEAGALLVRGPQLMDGYYERPAETAQVLRDGWLHTGAVAYSDGDGYVVPVDRTKEQTPRAS